MVFDNVDDAAVVEKHAPSANGSILVTTRYKGLVHELRAECMQELNPLEPGKSFDLFSGLRQLWDVSPSAVEQVDESSQIELFLQELDGLPLAIEQMAAYASFNAVSIKELHRTFNRSFKMVARRTSKMDEWRCRTRPRGEVYNVYGHYLGHPVFGTYA